MSARIVITILATSSSSSIEIDGACSSCCSQ
jgi:hypothetical protein